jgi:hypothetical protein
MTDTLPRERRPLHLVERLRPMSKLAVQISATNGSSPYGRSRIFDIAGRDLPELLAVAERLEARR